MRRPRNYQLALRAGIVATVAVLAGALACPGAALAQAFKLPRIGPYTVGSKLADVRNYRRTSDDCQVDKIEADCTFVAPNGVQYVVMGNTVTEVIAADRSVHRDVPLPFGLKLGEHLDSALAKLIAQGRRWIVGPSEIEPKEGLVVLNSEDVYQGENGAAFGVDVFFDHDRLIRINYDSGQAN